MKEPAYREAVYLAKGGHVWFPMNPLITLYSEGKYYADEDGLYERQTSGHPVPRARLLAGLPGDLRRVVYPWGAATWGIAQRETGNAGRRFGLLWFVVERKPPRTASGRRQRQSWAGVIEPAVGPVPAGPDAPGDLLAGPPRRFILPRDRADPRPAGLCS